MEKITLSRHELYDLVWTQTVRALSKKFNIAEFELRKICKKMNIPLPPNGHWSKVQFNKPITRIELPDEYEDKKEIAFGEYGVVDDDPASPINIEKKLKEEIETLTELALKVPYRLTNPDKLIINTKNYYEALKQYDCRSGKPRPSNDNTISMDVSDRSLPRAFRIMDTVIKILRSRHHNITKKYSDTVAMIYGEPIEFRLRERNKVSETKDRWGNNQFETTGEFIFIVGPNYHKKEIHDGKINLEYKLVKIISLLESEGQIARDRTIRWEINRKEQEERERIAKELKERRDKELADFKNLFNQAKRLKVAMILREYISELERSKSGMITEEFRTWLKWAQDKADWYDPLLNRQDDNLTSADKLLQF